MGPAIFDSFIRDPIKRRALYWQNAVFITRMFIKSVSRILTKIVIIIFESLLMSF